MNIFLKDFKYLTYPFRRIYFCSKNLCHIDELFDIQKVFLWPIVNLCIK